MWWNIRPDVWEIVCTFQSTDTEVHVASLFSQDKTGQITTSIKHTNKNVHGHQGEPCSTPLTISDVGCHDNRQFFLPSCISDKIPSLQTRHTSSHKRALLPRLLLGGYYIASLSHPACRLLLYRTEGRFQFTLPKHLSLSLLQ